MSLLDKYKNDHYNKYHISCNQVYHWEIINNNNFKEVEGYQNWVN